MRIFSYIWAILLVLTIQLLDKPIFLLCIPLSVVFTTCFDQPVSDIDLSSKDRLKIVSLSLSRLIMFAISRDYQDNHQTYTVADYVEKERTTLRDGRCAGGLER